MILIWKYAKFKVQPDILNGGINSAYNMVFHNNYIESCFPQRCEVDAV